MRLQSQSWYHNLLILTADDSELANESNSVCYSSAVTTQSPRSYSVKCGGSLASERGLAITGGYGLIMIVENSGLRMVRHDFAHAQILIMPVGDRSSCSLLPALEF